MFNDFFNELNNTFVEREDPTNPDQCFDLVFAWVDTLQIPRETIRHLLAYQIYTVLNTSTLQYFDKIENTPEAIPQEGDIIVWSKDYNKGAGHCGISNGIGDINTFECF